jgi:crotonobetainyl-CoA:carnitine CoA-transferase CaiB-like acyl-CoA transferase
MKLLEDIVVVDFSQFLSGPSAALRLADMGAQVIKIERPETGDICRQLYVSDIMIEGESTIFHAINRNKQSYTADLKNSQDLEKVKQLLKKADVMLHNFRPGVMQRLGLDYETIKAINPGIVYAEVSGYGNEGPLKDAPGQDLLLQAISGLTWLSNSSNQHPTPMGVAVVDILAGTHLAQGILACLYQRTITGEGAFVQVSMFESILDFQFEVLTCYYNDGKQLPIRSAVNGANAYIAAPYGIYETSDGHIAIAMVDIIKLGQLLHCKPLELYTDPSKWYDQRDEIKAIIAAHLVSKHSSYWLNILEPADVWCAKVLDYKAIVQEEAYHALNMEIVVQTSSSIEITTTRCPIKVDGQYFTSAIGAPLLGEHNAQVDQQFGLNHLQPSNFIS